MRFIEFGLARPQIDATRIQDMGAIGQRGFDSADGEGDGRLHSDRRAIILGVSARIEIIIRRIVVWGIFGQDDTFAHRDDESAPQAKDFATCDAGMHIDRDIADRHITRPTVIEPNRSGIVAGG